jgi:hypothetical protein
MPSTRKARGGRERPGGGVRGPQKAPTVAQRAAAAHAAASTPKRADGAKARELVKRVGRPSKISEDLVYRIGEMVLEGNYRRVAASANGVSPGTLDNWLAMGAEYEGSDPADLDETQALYVEFLGLLRVCEAHAEADLLAAWRKGQTGWQAYATLMERRWPARWKKREEMEFTGDVGVRATLSPEQQEEELAGFGLAGAVAVARGPEAVEPPEDA